VPGLAGFCHGVEKTVFFCGKNRLGKNNFCWQKQKTGFSQQLAKQT